MSYSTWRVNDFVEAKSQRPGREPGRWKLSAIAIDRDAADVLRFRGFRHGYGQDAVLERGRHFVLVDVLQRYAPFEPAIIPLAEPTCLVLRLRFFLAGDRNNAVRDFQADVLFVEARQFGGDAHLLVRLIDVDLGPAKPAQSPGRSERHKI